MKAVQKLEIASGLTALIFAVIEFVVFGLVENQFRTERHEPFLRVIITGIIFQLLPVFVMAVGSIIHVFRKSQIGFIIVLFFGVTTLLTKAFMFLLINSFYDYGRLADIVVALSGIFTALAMLFAFLSRKSTRLLA